jgi:hypothetical protein
MASEKRPPESTNNRRRRPAAVIDLEATKVAPETTASGPPAEAASAPPEPLLAESPPAPPPQEVEVQPEQALPPPPPEPPAEPPRAAMPPPPERDAPVSWLFGGLSWLHASAGITGALLVFFLLWLVGAFSGGRDSSADLSPRLAAIEKQLNELASPPGSASADPKLTTKALDEMGARLSRLESVQAAPRAPVTDPVVLGRLTAAENALKSLADNAAAASRRAEALDASLRDINGKIDKLAATLAEVQTTARAAAAGSDRASRLAVAAQALRSAVERGDPFAGELAIVRPLTTETDVLAALEPFAASGMPSNAALGQELAAIVRKMPHAEPKAPSNGGFLDKLQANAEKLVRIRPVGEARGNDREAILARIEYSASQGNLSAAMADLAKLSPEEREPAQGWIVKVGARNRAIEASRRLATDAVAALKAAP